jgi:hypothetical protein
VFSKGRGEEERRRKNIQIGTGDRASIFNAGLLARSQFAYERFCDLPPRSRFPVVFLGLRANAELVSKIHVHCMLHMQPSQCNIKNFALMYLS